MPFMHLHTRHLSPYLKLATLTGGFFNQFGWAFFGCGLLFSIVFLRMADFTSLFILGRVVQVNGTVDSIEETGASEGGSDNTPGTPIYRYRFSYYYDGSFHQGVSYRKGKREEINQNVQVQVPVSQPQKAVILGQRRNIFAPWIALVLIFPAAGLGMLIAGIKRSLKALRLLQSGVLAEAKFVSMTPTNTSINKRTVYELKFEFQAVDGQIYRISDKTHETELLTDDEREMLIYNPQNPHDAMMIDTFPGRPQISLTKQIIAAPRAALLFIAPGLSILVNGACVYYLMG